MLEAIMEEFKHENRDENGDIKFDIGTFDWTAFQKASYTYIFHFYDVEKEHHFPYFELFSTADNRLQRAKQHPDYYEIELYSMPQQPPYNFFIRYHNWQLHLLVSFFKEVFEERSFKEGYHPSHKYERIILPKHLYEQIINTINDFDLLQIKDLLFEIIAIAQNLYVKKIASWGNSAMQKLATTAQKEANKAIAILKKTESKSWEEDEVAQTDSPSELMHINFVFNDETIKIEHNWLANDFIEYFKQHYNELPFKSWETELGKYHEMFEDNIRSQQFKYKLAKSYYNLFTKAGFFKITTKESTPNRLMLCIAKLLEFSLIPVGGNDELEEVKIKHMRNWISRNNFEPELTHLNLPLNKERLEKYFEPALVNLTGDIKKADTLSIAMFIGERFHINRLIPDLAHIAQALKEIGWLIGHQLIGEGNGFNPHKFAEFIAFKQFINSINQGKKLTSLIFRLGGSDTEHELSQRLPLYLIEQSIKEYVKEQQVEFDTDPVKTEFKRLEDGSIELNRDEKFNMPHERFIVRFVKSFYTYLLAEAPPQDVKDFNPSERYFNIIAVMLQETWFFYHKRHSERFISEKVKEWYQLSNLA